MKQTLVRYKTKLDQADENKRLIEKVFEQLQAEMPDGFRYLVLKLADGSFVHFKADIKDNAAPLTSLKAFQAFQHGHADRCLEPPQVGEAIIVGSYRMFGM